MGHGGCDKLTVCTHVRFLLGVRTVRVGIWNYIMLVAIVLRRK